MNGAQSMRGAHAQRDFDWQQATPPAAAVLDVGRQGDLQAAAGGGHATGGEVALEGAADHGQDDIRERAAQPAADGADVGVGEFGADQAPAPRYGSVERQRQGGQGGVGHHFVQGQQRCAHFLGCELHGALDQILSGPGPVLDPLGDSPAGVDFGPERVVPAVAVRGRSWPILVGAPRAAVEQDLEEIVGAQAVCRGEMDLDQQRVSAVRVGGQEVSFPERPLRIEGLSESGVECGGGIALGSDVDVLFGFEGRRAPPRGAEGRCLHAESEPGQTAKAPHQLQDVPALDPAFDPCQAGDVQSRALALQVPEEGAVGRQRFVGGRHGVDSPVAGWRLRNRARWR